MIVIIAGEVEMRALAHSIAGMGKSQCAVTENGARIGDVALWPVLKEYIQCPAFRSAGNPVVPQDREAVIKTIDADGVCHASCDIKRRQINQLFAGRVASYTPGRRWRFPERRLK
jgi:hypothetical protein